MNASVSDITPTGLKRDKTKHRITYKVRSTLREGCKICGYRHATRSYGVHACERCQIFFRQSMLFKQSYDCIGSADKKGVCTIRFSEMTKCPQCHLTKCIKRGMSRLAVKLYRRGSWKSLSLKVPNVIRKLTRSYFKVFRDYERGIKSDEIKPLLLSDQPLESGTTSYKAAMFSQLCVHYQSLVNDIVKFSQHIPGFNRLPADDQLILLKTGFIDVWLILSACRLTLVQDSITLFNGTQIPICEVTTVYTKDYVTSILDISDECRSLKLFRSDRAAIIALAILSPDRPNLIEKELVAEMQTKLIASVKTYTKIIRPGNANFSDKLMNLLSNIYDIGKQHSLLLGVYRSEVEKLSISPVITELFDLHPAHAYKES